MSVHLSNLKKLLESCFFCFLSWLSLGLGRRRHRRLRTLVNGLVWQQVTVMPRTSWNAGPGRFVGPAAGRKFLRPRLSWSYYSLQPLATHTRAPEISHSCWYSSTCSHSQGSSYSLWKTLPKSNASGDIEHEVRISKLPYIKTHSNNLRASAIASKHLQLANIRM